MRAVIPDWEPNDHDLQSIKDYYNLSDSDVDSMDITEIEDRLYAIQETMEDYGRDNL